jgi:hypothetical protein
VKVGLDGHLGSAVGAAEDARGGADEVPDSADVDDETVERASGGRSAKP